MRKTFLYRCVAAVVGCGVFSLVRIDVVEEFWARLAAQTGSNLSYRCFVRHGPHTHGVNAVYPKTSKNHRPKEWTYIVTSCTYVHVAALAFPFFVRRLAFYEVLRGALAALLLAGGFNFLRFLVMYELRRQDFTRFVAHDIPNAVATILVVGIAVCYFVRHERRARSAQQNAAAVLVS